MASVKAQPTRIRLVIRINRKDGTYRNAWFRIVSIHHLSSLRSARRSAVQYRRRGYLARVRRCFGYFVVAVRKPRVYKPTTEQMRWK
jgi:hypothetical protein